MVEVRRKPNESTGSLLRRFSRFMQQSGILMRARKLQHREKKANERREKNAAIMGTHLRKLRQDMEKHGTYSEENFQDAKRRLKQGIKL